VAHFTLENYSLNGKHKRNESRVKFAFYFTFRPGLQSRRKIAIAAALSFS